MSGRPPPGLDTPLTAADVQKDALTFLHELVDRFGDIARYTVDGRPVVFVNRPEYARHVLQERHRVYTKSGTPDMLMLRPMLGDGLLTTDGDVWMQQRRMAQPAFHRARVESFADVIVEETGRTISAWSTHAERSEPFEVGDELTQLTTRVVARALFGADVSHLVESFGAAVQAMNEFMGHYDPGDQARLQRFLAARALIDTIVQDIIAQRRLDVEAGADAGQDFLSVLLTARDEGGAPLPRKAVRDQVMTLLMAGHETTAKALTWSLYLLDAHPEETASVLSEIDGALGDRSPTVSDLRGLARALQVLYEAMRLYPPVWIISRTASDDDEIGEWSIPAGTLVLVSPYMLHRHPDYWDRPDVFDPERFRPGAEEDRASFSFLPFSAGPRQCIGKHFATLEAHLALVMILRRWRVAVVPGHRVEPEALVTLRPRYGLSVRVRDRMTAASESSGYSVNEP